MAAAAAIQLHHFKDDDTSDHDVGMSLSPAPSPDTTLTPIEAAQLSAQAKEAVNAAAEQSIPVEEEGASALLPRPTENIDTFLTPTGALNMSGVVSQEKMNSANHDISETPSREQQLESRITQLEQQLARLTEVCNGLVEHQQVRTEYLDSQVRELVQQMVREDLSRFGLCRSCHQVSRTAAIYRVAS